MTSVAVNMPSVVVENEFIKQYNVVETFYLRINSKSVWGEQFYMSSYFFIIGVAITVLDIVAAFFIIIWFFRNKSTSSDRNHNTNDRHIETKTETSEKVFRERMYDDYAPEEDSIPHSVFSKDFDLEPAADNIEVNTRYSGLEDLNNTIYVFRSTENVWVCPYCDAENTPENRKCLVCGERKE